MAEPFMVKLIHYSKIKTFNKAPQAILVHDTRTGLACIGTCGKTAKRKHVSSQNMVLKIMCILNSLIGMCMLALLLL